MSDIETQAAPEGVIKIQLGEHVALVDEADAELVAGHTWRPWCAKTGKVYVYTVINNKTVFLHRHILNTAAGLDTDHWNGDSLDNRRSNLRPATRAENVANTPKSKRKDGRPWTSQYKGVCLNREQGRWQASIRIKGRLKFLGRFDDEIEAALAYDRAAFEVHPKFAQLNLPGQVQDEAAA